jgi:hypothetical protein
MRKRLLGLVLFVFIIVISLGGCASMQEMCGPQKRADATPPPPVAVVRPAPQPPPPAVVAAPPIKKDRN